MKVIFYLLPCALFALPHTPTVIQGGAEFSQETTRLLISCKGDATIDWPSFSIRSGEEVHFLQNSPNDLAINRVLGPLSEIQGLLQANGRILLINPNGILVGKNGVVDTGSFIASSLDLLNHDGDLHFSGKSTASVVNQGTIIAHSGDVLLIGALPENQGEISALNGAAAILATREVWLPSDTALLFPEAEADALEEEGGFLIYKAVNHGSVSGKDVYVLGEHVEVEGKIDASHPGKGGRIFIGGGKQGADGSLINAKKTWVGPNAHLSASALERGNGGQIIVWADEATCFSGRIAAEGGSLQGDGGFVEVSGGALSFLGNVSTHAPQGKTGTLLLDPNDIVINGGATSGGAFVGAFFDGTGFQPATLNNVELGTALDMNNVLVQTSNPTPGGSGDISFQANVTWTTAGNSLTVSAFRDINILDSVAITASGAGDNITLTAARNIDCRGSVRNIEFATSTGGAVTLSATAGSINIGNSASLVVPSGVVGNIFGQITVSAPQGSINLLGGAALNSYALIGNDNNGFALAPALSSGNILVEAGQDFTMLGGSNTSTLVSISRLPIPPIGIPPMTNNAVGNITVNVGRNMNVQSGTAGVFNRTDGAFIGHGMGGGYVGTNTARSRLGNILINVGNNLTMTHSQATNVGTGDPTSIPFIGTNRVTSVALGYTGSITVNVGNDLLMRGLAPAGRLNAAVIGSQSTGAIADAGNYQIPLYINVGHNFCLDARNCLIIVGTQNNGALPATFPTEFFIHVGNNLALIGGNGNATAGASAQIRHNTASVNMRYQAWAEGNIVCVNGFNGPTGGFAELHLPATFAAGGQRVLYDTNVRSAGDIRVAGGSLAAGINYSSNGGIFYQADSPFAQGELWAAQTAIVNGANIFTGTPLASASPAQGANGIGAIRFDAQRYNNNAFSCATLTGNVASPLFPVAVPIVYQAHNGQDITILTTQQFATLAGPADLTTGTGNGQISFNNSPRAVAGQTQPVAGRNIRISAFRNITITGASLTAPAGNILAIANNNFSVTTSGNITASGSVTLVSDNQAPAAPLIGPGGFTIDATSQINAGTTVRIFTAIPNNPPNQNNISLLALINGQTIGSYAAAFGFPDFPGNPYLSDSALEIYCTYYNVPAGNIYAGSPFGGVPFTIFYKPCAPIVAQQATVVVDEFLLDLHPYNEFPGWLERFHFLWKTETFGLPDEPFYFRRRNLNLFNHPKSWTLLFPD